MKHRCEHGLAGEKGIEVTQDQSHRGFCRFWRLPGDMGRQYRVRKRLEGVGNIRFLVEHVQGRTGQLTALQCLGQGLGIDDAGPSDVDQVALGPSALSTCAFTRWRVSAPPGVATTRISTASARAGTLSWPV